MAGSHIEDDAASFASEMERASWVDDGSATACMRCRTPFKFFRRRRHHCRKCGNLVCSACSRHKQVVPEFDPRKPQRVCGDCADVPDDTLTNGCSTVDVSGRETVQAEHLNGTLTSGDAESREFGTLEVGVIEARGLLAADTNLVGAKTKSDPYCLVRVGNGPGIKTRTINGTLDPRWDTGLSFRVSRPNATLDLKVFDEDLLSADDLIGSVKVPLGPLHPTDRPFRSWFPLVPPEGEDGPAGAVLLELRFRDVRPMKHLLSYVAPLPPVPPPLPDFDIDAVYGPLMHIIDLLWNRLSSPVLFFVLDLIFWARPVRSITALVLWNLSSRYLLAHWPAMALMGLALYSLSHRKSQPVVGQAQGQGQATKSKTLGRQKTAPIDAGSGGTSANGAEADSVESNGVSVADDEAQLGAAIQRLCFVLPRWLKELCRSLAPTLRTAADGLQTVRDLFKWNHSGSPGLVGGLVAGALVCEALSLSTVLMVVGSTVLLACSPIASVVGGLSSYAGWVLGNRCSGPPVCWNSSTEYQAEWSSEDSVAVAAKASMSRRKPALLRRWTTGFVMDSSTNPLAESSERVLSFDAAPCETRR